MTKITLIGDVKAWRFLSLGSNTGDIITLQSSVFVELCRARFDLIAFVLGYSISMEWGKSFDLALSESPNK